MCMMSTWYNKYVYVAYVHVYDICKDVSVCACNACACMEMLCVCVYVNSM